MDAAKMGGGRKSTEAGVRVGQLGTVEGLIEREREWLISYLP